LNITTKGDAVQDRSLAAIGTDSLFVKELEHALRDGRADYAVHSCKDLPSTLPDDMLLAAVTVREDPRDAYCSERFPTFDDLPAGARVGTSSPRRRAQLAALRPDLRFDDIRGNVDTRLRKLRDGDYDAIILASAGMKRLDLRATYTVPFPVDVLVPAVAQGALAIEMRDGDPNAARIGGILGDPHTDLAVRAERAFLRTLRGGCQAPVGAHATYDGTTLRMHAAIAAPDGSAVIRDDFADAIARVEDAETAAVALANTMLAAGGNALLAAVIAPPPPEPGTLAGLVFVIGRTQDGPSRIASALREEGAEVVEAADAGAATAAMAGRAPNAVLVPSSGSVRAITEYLAALRDNGSRPLVVAMGPSSAATAAECGWPPDVVAPDADIASFVQTVTRTLLENAP
jgi:hydroxymethylbilane synthase